MSDVSFQIAKKYKQQRDWKQEEKKKKREKKIYMKSYDISIAIYL